MARFFVKRTIPMSSAERASYMQGVATRRAAQRAAMRPIGASRRVLAANSGEYKSVDTDFQLDGNTTGSVQLLNGIARGDEIFERSGREVVMKSIELRFACQSTSTTGIAQINRVMLVYDKQPNGAALTIANVINSVGNGYMPFEPRNLENRRRFWILMDRSYAVGPQGPTTTALGASPIVIDKFYKRITLPITFNSGDAGTVADITTGSLYLITMGNVAAGDTDANVNGHARIRFQDK